MEYLIGVDVGSSDCKVMIVRSDGEVAAAHTLSYSTHYPRPGWAEQDAEDWYRVACQSIKVCVEASSIDPLKVAGISIDGPAHNVAVMDEYGNVLRPVIHWSDLRSTPQSERLKARCGDVIFSSTYTPANPSWTLTQLMWLQENEPATWAKARRFLVTKDYVRYRFTGTYQTDIYDAIGTQLYDIPRDCWSQELCDLIGLDIGWLPPIAPASSISGALLPEVAAVCGLPGGIPVAVGSGDSVVEALGIGAIRPGQCIVKLGTAANVNLVTDRPYPSFQAMTYRHVVPDRWFTITATNSGAVTMRWFRDTFCRLEVQQAKKQGISIYELINRLAEDIPAGAQGLIFHPYLMGERSPHWDPMLRGDFIGVSQQHGTHHFARAVLEGVAYSIRDCLNVVDSLGQRVTAYYLIGGGAKSPLWRQILCDVLGHPLTRPAVEDTAFGAAMLAGVAVGVFADWHEAVQTCSQVEEELKPDAAAHELYSEYFDIYRAVADDLRIHSHRLVQMTGQ